MPVVDGRRGNPIVPDEAALAQNPRQRHPSGCRHLIDRNPDLVSVHETANPRFVTNLDTIEDVRELARRTGWRLDLPETEPAH